MTIGDRDGFMRLEQSTRPLILIPKSIIFENAGHNLRYGSRWSEQMGQKGPEVAQNPRYSDRLRSLKAESADLLGPYRKIWPGMEKLL